MANHPQYVWWNCLLCPFRMHDDGSVEAAQRMGEHIAEHERLRTPNVTFKSGLPMATRQGLKGRVMAKEQTILPRAVIPKDPIPFPPSPARLHATRERIRTVAAEMTIPLTVDELEKFSLLFLGCED